jgi:hypothetical protein
VSTCPVNVLHSTPLCHHAVSFMSSSFPGQTTVPELTLMDLHLEERKMSSIIFLTIDFLIWNRDVSGDKYVGIIVVY